MLRAMSSSKLKGSALKATLLVNHYAGPFHTKKNKYTLQEGAELLCQTCTDDWLESLQESYQFDVGDATAVLTRDKILEARGVSSRLPRESWLRLLEILAVPLPWCS